MADFEVMDRSMKQDEEAAKNATKVSFVIDKQDMEAILNLPLGELTEEDLKPLER
jgi:DNA gyrase/topoisomerase IV subunit A